MGFRARSSFRALDHTDLIISKILCVDDGRDGMATRKEVLESDGHQVGQTEEIELGDPRLFPCKYNGSEAGDRNEAAEPCFGNRYALRLWAVTRGSCGSCE
jgi:hypothetical protein